MAASNSIAPSKFALDLYLDGADWKLALFTADGVTAIGAAPTKVGKVDVATGGIVAIPLSLRDLGGDAANELRIFGGGKIKVVHLGRASEDFPVAELTAVDGEVLNQQIETIKAIGAGITRVSIAWGG